MHLLWRIENYLKRSGTSATRFGREVAHDPRLVLDMRNGREPKTAMTGRLTRFLDEREAALAPHVCGR
jgi:hypothetical protein